VLAGRPVTVAAQAQAGLTQAIAVAGGPDRPLGVAARQAYSNGLDLAMGVGAVCVLLAAAAVYFGLRPPRAARLAASAVTPAMNMSTPNS
jgi:hypothetical protein